MGREMKLPFTAILVFGAVSMFTAAVVGPAAAQTTWPTRPIKLVVPYSPGGYTDLVGRITARFMEKELGQTVVVDNRSGAGGIVGTDAVAKAPADGYTLCVCSVGAISIAPIAQTTQYDPLKDLAPIGLVSNITQMVIVRSSLPINSMKDLVAYAKANPEKLTYASAGAGGLTYFSVELFLARTGTKMTHVPFRGGAPATIAVVSGDIDLSFTNLTDALPQVQAKTVRALAVTSLERSSFAPDVPTVAEEILPGFSVDTWNAVIAPHGTPEPIVERISGILKKMSVDPEVKADMARIGASTAYTEPTEFKKTIGQELEQWRTLLKETSIKQ